MAKVEIEQQSSHRRQNRFLLMLLVVAALVSAAKDLGRLHDLTSGAVGLVASAHQRINAAWQAPAEPSCTPVMAENDRSGQPYNWSGRVAPDQLAEMKRSNGGIDAAPAVGAELAMVVTERTVRSEPVEVSVPLLPQAPDVAISIPPPMNSGSRRVIGNRIANRSATVRVRHHDVRLNFTVRVPAEAELVSTLISDQMVATLPVSERRSAGVCPRAAQRPEFVKTRANVSPAYDQAQIHSSILEREVLASVNSPNIIKFKRADRVVSLDLLQLLRKLAAESGHDEKTADRPRALKRIILRPIPSAPAVAEDAH